MPWKSKSKNRKTAGGRHKSGGKRVRATSGRRASRGWSRKGKPAARASSGNRYRGGAVQLQMMPQQAFAPQVPAGFKVRPAAPKPLGGRF